MATHFMSVNENDLKWASQRRSMVEHQIRNRGVRDERLLAVLSKLPRERFLPEHARSEAYEDRAIPIAEGQTISQPYIVAYMTEQLLVTPESRVLEIGTGSGYQTAILVSLAKHVWSVERLPSLQQTAAEILDELGITNVTLIVGDGSLGHAEHAPYDRILVTAGAPSIPEALVDQLSEGGILVLPVGPAPDQTIVRVERKKGKSIETPLLPCRFVKLIGRQGWQTPG